MSSHRRQNRSFKPLLSGTPRAEVNATFIDGFISEVMILFIQVLQDKFNEKI
jgi:hypothetical protein